jgi:hypothetical protein
MIPALFGFAAIFWAIIWGLPLAAMVALISYIILKRKNVGHEIVKSTLITIAFALIVICGLSIYFATLPYTGPPSPWLKPHVEEFEGSWEMPAVMIEYLQREGLPVHDHELILNSDGTFELVNMPYLYGPFDPNSTPISGQGLWMIDKISGDWVVHLNFHHIEPPRDYPYFDFIIEGRRAPFTLYVWKGDFTLLTFERK